MLSKRWGAGAMTKHASANEAVEASAQEYNRRADTGDIPPIYQFGEGVLDGTELTFASDQLRIPGFTHSVNLDLPNLYEDMS